MKHSAKKIKILTFLAITAGTFIIAASALAANDFSFSLPGGTAYKVGNTFSANIMISPAEKVYTAKAQVNYPANLLKIESFTFNSNWMPLSQPGYDSIDNVNGLMIKTAGYPGGVNSQVVLGTAVFRVLNSGNANLKFTSESLVLNANNANVAGTLASLNLTLNAISVPTPPTEEKTPKKEVLPKKEIAPREATPSEEITPEEKVVQPEKKVVVVPPEERAAEGGLASLLLASLGIIRETAWMMILAIFSFVGLIVIGIRERELAQKKKKSRA